MRYIWFVVDKVYQTVKNTIPMQTEHSKQIKAAIVPLLYYRQNSAALHAWAIAYECKKE